MSLRHSLLVVTVIFVGGTASAGPQNGLGVGISFLGTSTAETGRGVYLTDALSISVAFGPGDVTAGSWANETSVASAVGTEGSFLLGPQSGVDYTQIVCLEESCPVR